MAVAQEVTLAAVGDWFNGAGSTVLRRTSFAKPLRACAVAIGAGIKEHFAGSHGPDGEPWPPLAHPRPSGPGKPLWDFGLLMASVTARGKGNVTRITDRALEYGTNLDYAAIHQFGGVVRATRGKFLAIPLSKEARRVGNARDFPRRLFVLRAKNQAMLAERRKTKGKRAQDRLILHYVLKPSVTIPARPFLGLSAKTRETCALILGEHLAKAIAEAR